MDFQIAMPWHDGEVEMHKLLRIPEHDNPTVSALSQQAALMLQRGPLLAIGTLDGEQWPWTTLWGGEVGLSQLLGGNVIGIKTPVERTHDPVVQALFGSAADGAVVREEGAGRMVSALSIDLNTRKRVKLYGRMIAGAVATVATESDDGADVTVAQLAVRIDQSLGNCPKYINRKCVWPAAPAPSLVSMSALLPEAALALIRRADLFFVSTVNGATDMDTNHRGGAPGFVRTFTTSTAAIDETSVTTVTWPEYSGNRLYQSLGNMQRTARAGLVFPDFSTGDVLHLTGTTEILAGAAAAAALPHSNLAVRLTVTHSRFIRDGLPFRGAPPPGADAVAAASPYNPPVRPLRAEAATASARAGASNAPANTATLIAHTRLTPSISRLRFALANTAGARRAGQWVALDVARELDAGYSHMRDDDPRSLNDDFVRTFTVSSAPGVQAAAQGGASAGDEFDITIRRVGVVTEWLMAQNTRAVVEVGVLGFGGEFEIGAAKEGEGLRGFVAAGVGITPLLAEAETVDFAGLKVLWTIRAVDLGLVTDTLKKVSGLAARLTLFVTGGEDKEEQREMLQAVQRSGAKCNTRRLQRQDFEEHGDVVQKWFVCVGTAMRKSLVEWLGEGKEVVYEDFNF